MTQDAGKHPIREKIDQLNQEAWDARVHDSPGSFLLSQESVRLARSIHYPKGLAEGLRSLGFCYVRRLENEEGLACLNESFSLFESLGDLKGLSVVYEYLGIIRRNWGDLGGSLDLIFRALALSQQTGFTENESTNYYQLGVTYKHLGYYEKALEHLYKCLSAARSINYSLMVAYAINVIGSIYFDNGDYEKALSYYQEGLIVRRQTGDQWGEAGSLDNIGSTFLKMGSWQQAIDYCSQSLAISRGAGDKKGQANALLHLAEIYKQTNDTDLAAQYCRESLAIRQASGDKKGEAEILLFIAEMQRANEKGEHKDGQLEGLFRALEIAGEIKAIDLVAKLHWSLYESYKLTGNYPEALLQLEKHSQLEKELHKDTINKKVQNLEVSYKAEESKKEAEIFRLRNTELAGLYEEIKKQKEETEEQKKNLEKTLEELRATQAQLIQSEKMASLGELTAGIAHEIQNPLNFVNNFSEVNKELIEELKGIRHKAEGERNFQLEDELLDDIAQNEDKINHHGKRADAIVKGMLQHSRSSSGVKELTNINALCDEYVRLAYHGLRAKDKSFNAKLETDFDPSVGMINVVTQDIGRVILNLITNAFYVVNERQKAENGKLNAEGNKYEPTVTIATASIQPPLELAPTGRGGRSIQIKVSDNGGGIPQKILDKIFQPFFTTKPTGQGTGLGLSLSYDIVKAHGGEIRVETKEGEGTEFIIQLPLN